MKTMTKKFRLTVLSALLLWTVTLPLSAQSGRIKWLDDYDDGLKAARSDGRNIFLLITAPDWCQWCVELEKKTLPDAEVIALISEGFVPVKLLDGHPDIKKFKVEGFPTMMIISPQGKILATLPGFTEPAGLIEWCFRYSDSGSGGTAVDDEKKSGTIDSAMAGQSGRIYFFAGEKCILYDLRRSEVVKGYPKPTAEEFPGFTGTLTGAANPGNGYYYLFTESQYFKFRAESHNLENGFPKPFGSDSWPGLDSLFD